MCDYLSWDKTVQTLDAVLSVASRPGFCADPTCPGCHMRLLAAEGQQIAPRGSTYGYDVLARVGWLRQEHRGTLIPDVRDAIKDCLEVRPQVPERALLLSSRLKQISSNGLWRVVRRLGSKAGVEVTPHMRREKIELYASLPANRRGVPCLDATGEQAALSLRCLLSALNSRV